MYFPKLEKREPYTSRRTPYFSRRSRAKAGVQVYDGHRRVDITTDINEYNEIEITAVRVYLTKTSDRELVEKLIAEDLPDTQVIVQEE